MKKTPVVIKVPERVQITPSVSITSLSVVLTFLDTLPAWDRERVLRSVCFYFGFRLAKASDHSIIP